MQGKQNTCFLVTERNQSPLVQIQCLVSIWGLLGPQKSNFFHVVQRNPLFLAPVGMHSMPLIRVPIHGLMQSCHLTKYFNTNNVTITITINTNITIIITITITIRVSTDELGTVMKIVSPSYSSYIHDKNVYLLS